MAGQDVAKTGQNLPDPHLELIQELGEVNQDRAKAPPFENPLEKILEMDGDGWLRGRC